MRFAFPVLFAFAIALPAFAQEPDQATLQRLAAQLGAGTPQLPPNIDPELLKLAADYLKNNPQLADDPAFKQQVQQWKERAKADPDGLMKQLRQQNPGLTPDKLDQLKQQFQKPPAAPSPLGQNPMPPSPLNPPPMPNPRPGEPPNGMPTPPQPGKLPPSKDEAAKGKEGYQQAVGMWEKNFGDIEKTPALKQSLIDMFSGDGSNGKLGDANGNNPFGGKGNGSSANMGAGANGGQSGFVQWMKGISSGGPPTWMKNMFNGNNNLGGGNTGGGSNWSPPANSGGGSGGGGFSGGSADFGGLGAMGVTFAVLIVLAVVGFVVWRYWPQLQTLAGKPKPVAGLGEWTLDPREVVDRETLVKAFDYFSVFLCGDDAVVWNHQTIADAFRQNVPGAAPFADPLARLYALARYSPTNEPISPADIAEARGYLCRLAGVRG